MIQFDFSRLLHVLYETVCPCIMIANEINEAQECLILMWGVLLITNVHKSRAFTSVHSLHGQIFGFFF